MNIKMYALCRRKMLKLAPNVIPLQSKTNHQVISFESKRQNEITVVRILLKIHGWIKNCNLDYSLHGCTQSFCRRKKGERGNKAADCKGELLIIGMLFPSNIELNLNLNNIQGCWDLILSKKICYNYTSNFYHSGIIPVFRFLLQSFLLHSKIAART